MKPYSTTKKRIALLSVLGGACVLVAHVVYAASWFVTLGSAMGLFFFVELLGWLLVLDRADAQREGEPTSTRSQGFEGEDREDREDQGGSR